MCNTVLTPQRKRMGEKCSCSQATCVMREKLLIISNIHSIGLYKAYCANKTITNSCVFLIFSKG